MSVASLRAALSVSTREKAVPGAQDSGLPRR